MEDIKLNHQEDKYDIDLNNFEKITLHNKHEYIKVINKKDNSIVMLDITNINMPLIVYMKLLQDSSISYKTNDAIYNANGIIEQQQKAKVDLKFESVENINLNKIDDSEKRKIVTMFVQNKDRFTPKIKYVNSSEGIALNENEKVVEIFFNNYTNKYESRYAATEVVKSEEKMTNATFNGNFDGIDFEATMDYLEIDNKSITLGSETITLEEIEKYDKDETSLKNSNMSEYKKAFIFRLLNIYRVRKLKNNEKTINNPPKIKILKNNNQKDKAAFASNTLIAFLSGFSSSIIIFLLIYTIIRLFIK